MYAGFFGLRELPFNNTPDPRFFFSTPDHEEALASLIYGVNERKGFVLLTGEVGTGKTLISRLMLRHFGTKIAFANVSHTSCTPSDMLESILTDFDLPIPQNRSNTQMMRVLHDFLLAQFSQNMPVVLILDEAQNLPVEVFEQLRMIGNLEADDAKLLQIIILGQPELRTAFQSRDLRQLRQRVFRSFHLPQLDLARAEGYIRHRLAVAGAGSTEIFDPCAIDFIWQESCGLPRLINTICDNAMLSAYSVDRKTIDRAFVESVVEQMMAIGDDQCLSTSRKPDPSIEQHASTTHRQMPASSRRACVDSSFEDSGEFDDHITRENSRRNSEALRSMRRTIQQEVDAIAARVEMVEESAARAAMDTSQARTLRNDLMAGAERANQTLARVETLSANLTRNEERVSKMLGITKTVLSETQAILIRLNRVAAATNRAERRAKHTSEKIDEQSNHVTRLLSTLKGVLGDIETHRSAMSQDLRIQKVASMPAEEVTPTSPPQRRVHQTRRFVELLSSSRESLADLRDLIADNAETRRPGEETEKTNRESASEDSLPTGRLAEQVRSLVDLVQTTQTQ